MSAFRRNGKWVAKFTLDGTQYWVPGGPWERKSHAVEAERRHRERLKARRTDETCASFTDRWLEEWARPEASTRRHQWMLLRADLREAAAALRSTPEADPRFAVERGFDGEPVIVEQPSSPLLALADELEARADEQSGGFQVPIGNWTARHWSLLRAWKGATLAYRDAALLARDYATREEADDDE